MDERPNFFSDGITLEEVRNSFLRIYAVNTRACRGSPRGCTPEIMEQVRDSFICRVLEGSTNLTREQLIKCFNGMRYPHTSCDATIDWINWRFEQEGIKYKIETITLSNNGQISKFYNFCRKSR